MRTAMACARRRLLRSGARTTQASGAEAATFVMLHLGLGNILMALALIRQSRWLACMAVLQLISYVFAKPAVRSTSG